MTSAFFIAAGRKHFPRHVCSAYFFAVCRVFFSLTISAEKFFINFCKTSLLCNNVTEIFPRFDYNNRKTKGGT